MRMLGPGCAALINPSIGLNASVNLPMPVAGSVASMIGNAGMCAVFRRLGFTLDVEADQAVVAKLALGPR